MIEEFEVVYIEKKTISASLREVAKMLRKDEELVLIGMWNTEPMRGDTEGALQVVFSHLKDWK